MKTLTVRLPEQLVAEINAESRERKMSKSDVIRERLQARSKSGKHLSTPVELIGDLIGSVDGLPRDLSARKKHYLKAAAMAANVLVDAGFVVALLSRRDSHHDWAVAQSERLPPPWKTCEAALSEAFHLLGKPGGPMLRTLLGRGAIVIGFNLVSS